MTTDNPLKKLPVADVERWIELMAGCGLGEAMAQQTIPGLEPHHIAEVMEENNYERCSICDWWEDSCEQVDEEPVCVNCR